MSMANLHPTPAFGAITASANQVPSLVWAPHLRALSRDEDVPSRALAAEVRVSPLTIDDDLLVVSVPHERSSTGPLARLTPSEREILGCALEGLSNTQIAARRGRATRTIANQMAAILQKLGAGSRFALAATLASPERAP